jgi:excisionase family DNA binding protein
MSAMTAPVLSRPGTIKVGAQRYGVHPKTIRRMIARGELKAYRLGSRSIRIDLDELDAMLRPIPTAGDDGNA